jgi:adenine phosphoribosyltransferase
MISDLIATGGSAEAAGQLIKKSGGTTLEYLFVISLPFLKGEEKLDAPSYSLIQAED